MSEKNYAGLAFKIALEKHPETFIVTDADITSIEQGQAARRKAMDIINSKPEPARIEYNRLRKQLYDLQQEAKNTEIYANTAAGAVRLLETRINDLLKRKKSATEANLLGEERTCEHQIQQLETELLDVKTEFNRAVLQSARAGRALKAFDGHQRIRELKKELGA